MPKYRHDLPQRRGGIFLADGGLETTLIFHEGIDLPHFAAFVLLDKPEGRQKLRKYYESYLAIARDHGTGFVLDSRHGAPAWIGAKSWVMTRPRSGPSMSPAWLF
jgi:homocysteine S-methyltransferase